MSQTIGEQLKQARETRGVSLEQAAQVTRVRIHYLKALESDLRDQLPSNVQGRGFLRLYADYLGLTVQPLLDQWEGRIPPEVEKAVEPEPIPVEAQLDKNLQPDETIQEEIETGTAIEDAEFADNGENVEEMPGLAEESPEISPSTVPEKVTQLSPHIEKPGAATTGQSAAIFAEIGETLRHRRESISLSLSDVEHYTRLRQHYLRALESGRIEDLPSAVQGRGMLSNYAEFLNLDVDALLGRFADALQTRRVELQPAARPRASRPLAFPGASSTDGSSGTKPRGKAPATRMEIFGRLLTPDLLVISSLIIVLVVFVIWAATRVTALSEVAAEPTTRPISEVLLETSEPSITPTPAPTQSTPVPSDLLNAYTSGETTVDENTLPTVSNSPIQVYVIAQQRAWMRVTVDGKDAFNGRVVPGTAYPFSGSSQIELLTGNAAGLQVFYNQEDMGSLGIIGQVVDLIFLPESVIITPTPAFTATPTATQRPTLTPQPTPTQPTPTITPYVP
jgi:cytoskeletal protein RodZ